MIQQVVVGQTALPERLQLLSISSSPTVFRIAMIPHSSFIQPRLPARQMVVLSQSQGQLNRTGDIKTVDITFTAAPTTFTGLLTQDLLVMNSYDRSRQKITISVMVCVPALFVLLALLFN